MRHWGKSTRSPGNRNVSTSYYVEKTTKYIEMDILSSIFTFGNYDVVIITVLDVNFVNIYISQYNLFLCVSCGNFVTKSPIAIFREFQIYSIEV